MDRFPALRLILRLGRLGAALVALAAAAAVVMFAWSALGWFSLPVAFVVLALVYFLVKSYVEIIQILTEVVH